MLASQVAEKQEIYEDECQQKIALQSDLLTGLNIRAVDWLLQHNTMHARTS